MYTRVLLAMLVGVLLGHFSPELAVQFKPIADAFIALLKMLIPVLVFFAIVSGIVSVGRLTQIGKVTGWALVYFFIMSTSALLLGAVVALVFEPGSGFAVDFGGLEAASVDAYLNNRSENFIPKTFIQPFVDGNVIHILMLAAFFGITLASLSKDKKTLLPPIDATANVFFKMMDFILKLAPLSGFAAIAFAVGQFGLGILGKLFFLLISLYGACILFDFVFLGGWLKLATGASIIRLIVYLRDELAIVFATANSGSVLAPLIQKLEAIGVHPDVVRLMLPMGGSFNLDGSEIYLALTAVFIAQAMNIDLSMEQMLVLMGLLIAMSKGTAPITGGAIISLASILAAFQIIPVEGVLLVLGVDRFLGEGRALTNMMSNAVAVLLVAHHLGEWDKKERDKIWSIK